MVVALFTLYSVWDRGYCVSCEGITPTQINQVGTDAEAWKTLYHDQVYVPYTSFSSYLLDSLLPISMGWVTSILAFTLLYVGYLIYKRITRRLGHFLMKKYNLKKEHGRTTHNR